MVWQCRVTGHRTGLVEEAESRELLGEEEFWSLKVPSIRFWVQSDRRGGFETEKRTTTKKVPTEMKTFPEFLKRGEGLCGADPQEEAPPTLDDLHFSLDPHVLQGVRLAIPADRETHR